MDDGLLDQFGTNCNNIAQRNGRAWGSEPFLGLLTPCILQSCHTGERTCMSVPGP